MTQTEIKKLEMWVEAFRLTNYFTEGYAGYTVEGDTLYIYTCLEGDGHQNIPFIGPELATVFRQMGARTMCVLKGNHVMLKVV